jgi:hypothetical protein
VKVSGKEILLRLVVVLAASLFVFEAMATVWLALTEGTLFQLRPATPAGLSPAPSPISERSTVAILSPYFGYSLRPGITVEQLLGVRASPLFDAPNGVVWSRVRHQKASELGMWNDRPVPYVPDADEKVVGIFGASVAAWLVLQAGDQLAASLARAVPGKRIVLLNFGVPAGKQPQQLLLLSYLLSLGQHFDLVINIDGYAEVVFGSGNVDDGVNFTMPSTHMIKPIWRGSDAEPSFRNFSLLARYIEAKDKSATIARWRNHNRSAAMEMILRAMQIHFDRTAEAAMTDVMHIPSDARQDIYVMPKSLEASGIDALPHIAEHWRRSSSAMALMSNGVGAGYLHVLGPSPFAGARHFSRDELAIVQPDNPLSRRAAIGFPYLLARPPNLDGERAAYVAATGVFDHVPEPVYADAVHQNMRGAEIFSEFIARQANSRRLLH